MHITFALRTLALCTPPPRLTPLRMLSTGFNGPRQQQITERLTAALDPVHLEVLNTSHGRTEDESHFKVIVVSEAFEGKRVVGRHRAVNAAVAEEDGSLGFRAPNPLEDAARCAMPCPLVTPWLPRRRHASAIFALCPVSSRLRVCPQIRSRSAPRRRQQSGRWTVPCQSRRDAEAATAEGWSCDL